MPVLLLPTLIAISSLATNACAGSACSSIAISPTVWTEAFHRLLSVATAPRGRTDHHVLVVVCDGIESNRDEMPL